MLFGEIMTYLADYQEFLTDKQNLISGKPTRKDYAFLAKNRKLIKQEVDHLQNIVSNSEKKSNHTQNRYDYYSGLLSQYYVGHNEPEKAAKLQRRSKTVEDDSPMLHNAQKYLGIEKEPNAVGKLYKLLGNANMQRLESGFARATVRQALILASNLQYADSLIDISDMASVIDSAGPTFNALSLGLFACRFSINLAQIIQHTWFPTDEEKFSSLTAYERFCQEIYDRQYHLLNDIVWFSVNLFCNYNAYWNLSDLFAGQLTAIFLVFDALWLVYDRQRIEKEYLIKKEQYLDEIRQLDNKDQDALGAQEIENINSEKSLLKQQLAELELEWQRSNANYLFSIAAAAVFTAGYSATLLFASQAAIVFSFFICNIAVAMYLSANEWANYQQKAYLLEQDNTSVVAERELDEARNAFIFAMLKNTIMPLFITTCFAVCWPAAVAGTVLYISNYLLSETSEPSMPSLSAKTADNDEDSDDEDDQVEGVRLIS